MTEINPDPLPMRQSVCSTPSVLPDGLARTVLMWSRDPLGVPAGIRDLRCTLERHARGDHHALVCDITGRTAVWCRWPHDGSAHTLLVLPDCPATHPEHGGCCEYEGHPGGHSWQLADPWDSPTTE